MIKIHISKHIDALPENVWKVLADFPNVYKWATDIKHSQSTTPQTSGVGAGRTCHIPGFGSTDEKVTEWSEGKVLSYDVRASGPVKVGKNRWTLTKEGNGSRIDINLEGVMRWGIIGEIMGVVMVRPMMKRIMVRSLDGLKKHIETH